MALLVVLETLSPLERAVFLLREVFGYSHAEIATALDRSESAVRQAAHRAHEHVSARRPRFEADRSQQSEVVQRFLDACAGGDLNELMAVLAPDVTLWADGGGKVSAATRPLHGAGNVARWILGVLAKPQAQGVESELASINGEPGLLATLAGMPAGAVTFSVVEGRIAELRWVVNPDKLAGLGSGTADHPNMG